MSAKDRNSVHLRAAARLCGIATSYSDFEKKQVRTDDAVLIRMINAVQDHAVLSDPVQPEQIKALTMALRRHRIVCGLPASIVAWDGRMPGLWMWLQSDAKEIEVTLQAEEGASLSWKQSTTDAIRRGENRRVRLSSNLDIPFGYYNLEVHAGGKLEGSSFLIAAPRRLEGQDRAWGVFAPAYALKTAEPKPIGDYGDLHQAARFVRVQGGQFLGTLPILAGNYDAEFQNISPYSPGSRLFWNEIFLDTANLPGVDISADAKPQAANSGDLVDYKEAYRIKRDIAAHAADLFFTQHPRGDEGFQAYEKNNPCLHPYAEFRASSYPPAERKKMERFHLYAQYACHYQLSALKEEAKAGRCAELYIDYPVGIDLGGFDAQHFSHLFLEGFEVGAPPDLFFSKGQSWGFKPFHPRELEHDRFSYFRATIHHYFRYARMLRLDHVMGLYRLYCIPPGSPSSAGAYIYYPFQALLAVLCLEAHRHGGILIGEDLGTVPDAVEENLKAHAVNRMWIMQFSMAATPEKTFTGIDPAMIASLNTHDMFPFASFLTGKDIQELQRLGMIDEKNGEKILTERSGLLKRWQKLKDPFLYSLEKMAQSPAHFVMVSAEDLWRETEPQNIPGTTNQYPNWRRRFAVPLEEWGMRDNVKEALTILKTGRTAKEDIEG